MSVRAFGWAWEVRGLSTTERCVLMYLAERHNKNTGLVCPSQATIAEAVEIDLRSVQRALAVLEEAGHIERRLRVAPVGRGRRSDQYRLGCDRPEDVEGWPVDSRDQHDNLSGETARPTRQIQRDQHDISAATNTTPASPSIKEEPEVNRKGNRRTTPNPKPVGLGNRCDPSNPIHPRCRACGTNPRTLEADAKRKRSAESLGRNRAAIEMAPDEFEHEIAREYADEPELRRAAREAFGVGQNQETA